MTHFRSEDNHCFFNGFTEVDLELVNRFKKQMALANIYYHLGL